MGAEGFEPPKAEPSGLQPEPVVHLGNTPMVFRFDANQMNNLSPLNWLPGIEVIAPRHWSPEKTGVDVNLCPFSSVLKAGDE